MRLGPPRIAAFVDGSNLFYVQRDKLGWWINYRRLREYFESFGDVVACTFYAGQSDPPDPRHEAFYDRLAVEGFSIELKRVKTFYNADGTQWQKANLDVELVLDMFNQIENYDLAVLVSGDGDFERPLRLLRDRGKQIRVLSTYNATAGGIRRLAGPHFIELADFREHLQRDRAYQEA